MPVVVNDSCQIERMLQYQLTIGFAGYPEINAVYRKISDTVSYASLAASSQMEAADKDTLCRQASY